MMTRDTRHRPIDTGVLLRRLDGELDANERATVDAHLESCSECRALADALERRASRIGTVLAATDVRQPSPDEWRTVRSTVVASARRSAGPGPLLRIAAALVLALGIAAVASPPLRAWIVEQWHALTNGASVGDAASDAPVAPNADGAAAIAFRPGAPAVDVAFDVLQQAGTLNVRFGDGVDARLTVSAGGAQHVAVGAGLVRVSNRAVDAASYTLVLPARVDRVSIRFGARPPVVLRRAAAAAREIDLATGAVRNDAPRDDS